jgi:transcriptional regulator with XRE-family HTH domain
LSFVAGNIKYGRKLKRLTQAQLGDALGVTRGSIANWESEVSNPPLDIILKIAKMLGISVEDFMSGDLAKDGFALGWQSTGNLVQVNDDLVQVTAVSAVNEEGVNYEPANGEASRLRRRIKRLEEFISKKFPDFPLDEI